MNDRIITIPNQTKSNQNIQVESNLILKKQNIIKIYKIFQKVIEENLWVKFSLDVFYLVRNTNENSTPNHGDFVESHFVWCENNCLHKKNTTNTLNCVHILGHFFSNHLNWLQRLLSLVYVCTVCCLEIKACNRRE